MNTNEHTTREEEASYAKKSLKKGAAIWHILGGDILAHDFLVRQTRMLILLMVLIVFYIDNRYSCQQEIIQIDKLKKELIDVKYDALTRSSELMERSRQSRIEEYVSKRSSNLQTATSRPFLISN
ncbi:MAG: FtsL-like putative cell division protein [Phocaeicola sp.]